MFFNFYLYRRENLWVEKEYIKLKKRYLKLAGNGHWNIIIVIEKCVRKKEWKDTGMKRLTTEEFVEKSKKIHGEKYDYSKSIYKGHRNKIEIICLTHGSFFQLAHNHLKGAICFACSIKNKPQCHPKNILKFKKEANKIHNNLYNYSKSNYKGNKVKLEITCKTHGSFLQIPKSHLNGSGCPMCKLSKGELKIISFLDNNNIKYEYQKSFPNLINERHLKYDFYIPEKNILIEYDGIQHFKGGKIFNHILTKKEFDKLKIRDKIKSEYAIKNNINLIRIPYFKFKNIDRILKENL